ncbi:RHS repeat-associated core domain-containing protein, partial [Chengkuizengella marina]
QYYVGGLRATKESQDGDFTRYIYFQGNVIEELDQEGNPTARNIWGNQLLYREDMASNLGGYYFYNGHGDVVKVIAADGSKDVLKEYDYDIWGNVLTETSHETKTFDNPFQYTGEIYDEESGLIYLRARYYDPSMGRFITEDTYEGTISNPLSMNLYTYVHNNPLIYNDPSGHLLNAIIDSGHVDLSTVENTSNSTYNPILFKLFNSANFVYASPVDYHTMLDIAGVVPVIGEPADIINGILYTMEGDSVNAAFSYAAAVPIVGWGGTAGKFVVRLTDDGVDYALKNRIRHGYDRHLKDFSDLGITGKWKQDKERWYAINKEVLTEATHSFDHVLRDGNAVKGFYKKVDGVDVFVYIYKEGKTPGEIATTVKASEKQLRSRGIID